VFVEPRRDGHDLRLQLANPTMLEALQALDVDGSPSDPERFPFRLISRRMKNAKNSSGLDVDALFPEGSVNPAFANPDQIRALGLRDGAVVTIRSERSWIPAIVASDETVPMGVISMAHAWGDGPEHDAEFRRIGSCTSRLVDNEKSFDPVTGMPVMTAVPVTIERAPD
jgi:anaerobic selenocysteine-containing dehydrogenase